MNTTNSTFGINEVAGSIAEQFCSDEVFGYELYLKIKHAVDNDAEPDVQVCEAFEYWPWENILNFVDTNKCRVYELVCSILESALSEKTDINSLNAEEIYGKIGFLFFSVTQDTLDPITLASEIKEAAENETDIDYQVIESFERENSTTIAEMVEDITNAVIWLSQSFYKRMSECQELDLSDTNERLESALKSDYEKKLVINKCLKCPVCESTELTSMKPSIDEHGAFVSVSCDNCNQDWTESYSQVTYSDLDNCITDMSNEEVNEALQAMEKTNAVACFACDENEISLSKLSTGETGVIASYTCDDCESSWNENFTFTSVELD